MERANLLKNLHIKGNPLILFNIWDAGSAWAVQEIGAKVIATGSWSVAAAHGYDDGEKLPFDMVLANIKRIIASVDIPITIDLEGGYGKSSTKVQDNVLKIIEAGVVGINFEDQIIDGEGLYSIEDQCARISAIREVAKHTEIPIFINARTDLFFKLITAPYNYLMKYRRDSGERYYQLKALPLDRYEKLPYRCFSKENLFAMMAAKPLL